MGDRRSLGSWMAIAVGMLHSVAAHPPPAGSRPDSVLASGSATDLTGLRSTGKADFSSTDDDGDGLLDAVIVQVQLEVLSALGGGRSLRDPVPMTRRTDCN